MLVDLKARYLDLLVTALEADGSGCLHRPNGEEQGAIYVTRSKNSTKADIVVQYSFDEARCALQFEFSDQRPKLQFVAFYVDGLDKLWPALRKAMSANRLENRSHEPERGPQESYNLRAARA